MKAVEIRELSSDDLTVKLKEARAELFNLRFQRLPASWTTPLV